MENAIKMFKELTPELLLLAGGKGSMLAKMYQSDYPVPDGFVILPSAFSNGILKESSWNEIQNYLNILRKNNLNTQFAVRSSALSEDSAQASFAGEFETVLNVKEDEEIRSAIYTVYGSMHSERVKSYSTAHGIEQEHSIAVVVQLMIQSEIAGVLFTADPITGSHSKMVGNYVHGLGEQLVSGEANAYPFNYSRPNGIYDGPDEFKKIATKLYKIAIKLERQFGGPQDIEWAVSKGKLYILQSRPITTLKTINYDTYEVNDSIDGDFIWTNNNVGEAMPDVMTPFTWSLMRKLDVECNKLTGYYLGSGNICGRVYSNISMMLSFMKPLGISTKLGLKLIGDVFGRLPEVMEVPLYPFTLMDVIKELKIKSSANIKRMRAAQKNKDYYLETTQAWCDEMRKRICAANTKLELLKLWKEDITVYVSEIWAIFLGGASSAAILVKLNNQLTKLVGVEDANRLLSNLRGDNGLASLGPILSIDKVSKGKMNREEYLKLYGHRSPHEFEMSIPYPEEDENYVEKQIEEYRKSGLDAEKMLDRQYEQYKEAKKRFIGKYPHKQKWLERNSLNAMKAAQTREAIRSEFVKVLKTIRLFMLKLGKLTSINGDIFFLYYHEVEEFLGGNEAMLKHIQLRKINFQKYKELPPFPPFIRGRFDPFEWVKNPNRRTDFFDSTHSENNQDDSELLRGFAGASGKIEGIVRILNTPEEGEKLQPGEILVALTTNVGWTSLFPKAAAIVTDIGAPLSHAAIVARELGIPAVVGCGNATSKLKTGDKVLVDGGHGIVQLLK